MIELLQKLIYGHAHKWVLHHKRCQDKRHSAMNFDWVGTSMSNLWSAKYDKDTLYIYRVGTTFLWRKDGRYVAPRIGWQQLPDTVTTFDEAATMVAVLIRLEES